MTLNITVRTNPFQSLAPPHYIVFRSSDKCGLLITAFRNMSHAENRLSVVLGGGITLGILYVAGLVIYRLWFHPLAKYPGPFLNRISQVSCLTKSMSIGLRVVCSAGLLDGQLSFFLVLYSLANISQLPAIYAVIVGRLPMHTKTIHDKYGPIIRLSPNELSFNTSEAWEDIYGLGPGRPNLSKDPIHVGAIDPVPGVSTISMLSLIHI